MRNTCTESDCDRPAFGRGLCSRHYQLAVYHGSLPETSPERNCDHCGEAFTSRKWNATYCSKRCVDRARYLRSRTAVPRRAEACEQCGGSLKNRRADARFCSVKCGQDWRNTLTAAGLLVAKAASSRTCKGCGTEIAPQLRGNAQYCTRECKVRSRRHEAYGLTKDELDLLLIQHDSCAICRTLDWGRKGPQVDHCHENGRVRGILCVNCNNGLGRFRDRIDLLEAAIEYLSCQPA